jgi:zinc transporter ZupT
LALTGGHALPGLDQHVHISLLLTLFTGLSTGIGSLQGLLNHSINTRLLSLALSFSAGG